MVRNYVAWAWVMSLVLSSHVVAQNVWFREVSADRLVLSSVGLGDDEEKDIATGDFDKDGWVDVVVVRKEPFSIAGARGDVLLMNEGGVLTDRTAVLAPGFLAAPTDSRDVVVVDVDDDTWPDLIIANTFTQQPKCYRNRGNDGAGNWLGFADESSARLPDIFPVNQASGPQFCAVWAGDLTGDNKPDLYFSNYERKNGTTDALLINDGNGNFSDQTTSNLGTLANVAFGTSVEFHDVDRDGDLDILKMSTLYDQPPFQQGIYILYNNGMGVFNQFNTSRLPSADPYMFTGAFFTRGDYLDFYVVNDSVDSLITIADIQPDGGSINLTSTAVASPRTSGFGGNVKAVDVDGDNDLDIGLAPIDVDIANCGSATAKFALLIYNQDLNRFEEPWGASNDRNFHIDPHDFAFLDVDRDGRQDIFMGLCTGWAVFVQGVGLECPGDCAPVGGNGVVDTDDLLDAVAGWGGAVEACDVSPDDGKGNVGDGRVDIVDLITIRNVFGPCPN